MKIGSHPRTRICSNDLPELGKLLHEETEICEYADAGLSMLKKLIDLQNKLKWMSTGQKSKKEDMNELSPDQHLKKQNATICNHCTRPLFGNKKHHKTHYNADDHCHYSGDFLGVTHNYCNMNRRRRVIIPLFAHNVR